MGLETMERSAWAWMPVAALLLSWSEPAPAAAEPPFAPAPSVNPSATQGGRAAPGPPSTPSPSIAPRDGGTAGDLPPALPPEPGGGAAAVGPNPLATGLTLRRAPLGPTDCRLPI